MISVDKAIEFLEDAKPILLYARNKEVYNEYYKQKIEQYNEVIALLKSLATRCQDYDALLDELKDKIEYEDIFGIDIYDLEKKYLGGKND